MGEVVSKLNVKDANIMHKNNKQLILLKYIKELQQHIDEVAEEY